MKIAIFRTDYHPIDLAKYNCQEVGLAKALVDAGHNVTIVLAANPNDKVKYPEVIHSGDKFIHLVVVEYIVLPIIKYPLLKNVENILKDISPDVCHINEEMLPATFQIAKIAKNQGLKLVTLHGMYRRPSGFARSLYSFIHEKLFRPFLIKSFDEVFAKTNSAKEFLVKSGYSNPHVISIGLDVSMFNKVSSPDARAGCERQSVKDILYVGLFEKRRNIHFLLKVAAAAKGLPYRFVFVGDGPDFIFAKDFVSSHKLDNVVLPGALQQSQVAEYYSKASVFILASDYEIFGMVYLEAMYFGLPVVTNLNAGSYDLISFENGSVMDKLDTDAWLEEICRWVLVHNEQLQSKIKEKFFRNYTWQVVAAKYISILNKL